VLFEVLFEENEINYRCPKSQQVSLECSNVGKEQLRLTIIIT
jgi:hypothetical protein